MVKRIDILIPLDEKAVDIWQKELQKKH